MRNDERYDRDRNGRSDWTGGYRDYRRAAGGRNRDDDDDDARSYGSSSYGGGRKQSRETYPQTRRGDDWGRRPGFTPDYYSQGGDRETRSGYGVYGRDWPRQDREDRQSWRNQGREEDRGARFSEGRSPRAGEDGMSLYGSHGQRSYYEDQRFEGQSDEYDRGYAGHRQSTPDFEPDYMRWREQKMKSFDDDYRSYREQRQSKFSDDFETWRKQKTKTESASTSGSSTTSNAKN